MTRERARKGLMRADCFSLSYVEVDVLVVLLSSLLEYRTHHAGSPINQWRCWPLSDHPVEPAVSGGAGTVLQWYSLINEGVKSPAILHFDKM